MREFLSSTNLFIASRFIIKATNTNNWIFIVGGVDVFDVFVYYISDIHFENSLSALNCLSIFHTNSFIQLCSHFACAVLLFANNLRGCEQIPSNRNCFQKFDAHSLKCNDWRYQLKLWSFLFEGFAFISSHLFYQMKA